MSILVILVLGYVLFFSICLNSFDLIVLICYADIIFRKQTGQ